MPVSLEVGGICMNEIDTTQPEAAAPARRRWIIAGACGSVIVVALLGTQAGRSGANAAAGAAAAERPRVSFIEAKRGKDSAHVTLPATLQALQEATVYARTNGYIRRWTAEIGDRVSKGDVLAEIEAPELDRELDQARAQLGQIRAHLELARTTAVRYRALVKDEAVSSQEVDEKLGAVAAREADQAAAQAKLRQLESMKSFQRVVAPFSGTVVGRNVEIGSLVTAGSSSATPWLYKLVQSDTMRVFVSVPQSQLAASTPGAEADLFINELGQKPITAKVARTAGAFDPVTRTLLTELRVPNPDRKILPGMYGQVKLHVKYAEPPIVVPVNALLVTGDGLQIAVVDDADVVHVRKVKLGRDLGKEVEVLDGVTDHERVVNNPRDNIVEGLKVTAVAAPKPADKGKEPAKEPAKDAGKDAAKPAASAK